MSGGDNSAVMFVLECCRSEIDQPDICVLQCALVTLLLRNSQACQM